MNEKKHITDSNTLHPLCQLSFVDGTTSLFFQLIWRKHAFNATDGRPPCICLLWRFHYKHVSKSRKTFLHNFIFNRFSKSTHISGILRMICFHPLILLSVSFALLFFGIELRFGFHKEYVKLINVDVYI